MVIVLQSRALSGSDLWGIPTPERNQVIYTGYKDRPLAEVRAHAAQVHTALVELLNRLPLMTWSIRRIFPVCRQTGSPGSCLPKTFGSITPSTFPAHRLARVS